MQPRTRAIWVLLFLACGFTVISFRLIQIQLVDHELYRRMAIENHLRPEIIPPLRGSIRDSEGSVLAVTQQVYDVRLDTKLSGSESLPAIAQALGVPLRNLTSIFNRKNRDLVLATDLRSDDPAIARLRSLKLRGLIFDPRDERSYPNNELAAHVLGIVDGDDHGVAGIEKQMDGMLCGVPGERWVERDARHNEIPIYQARETPAQDGCDITLTIKTAVQHVVEDELDQIVQAYHPEGADIIVMNPHTGEIMAMGSRPTFDPNDRTTFKADRLRNRCISDMVEPGSIFKIITLAGAINEGMVTLQTPIFCENGSFLYAGRELHDDQRNGTLSVEEVLAQSSNIGFAKIALTYLHEQKLYNYARAFGIGQRTGLFGGQGESGGLFRPLNRWTALSITRIPMGQEVGATALQMIDAMCVIANGGKLVVPHLISKITDANGQVVKSYGTEVVRQVISPETAHQVTLALKQVTIDGTAKAIKIKGYSSYAAKTATAQKFVNGEYSHTQFVSSFLGFLPAEDPAFVALVMVDDPHTKHYYGAEVAAPVFADMARQVAQILYVPEDEPISPTPVQSGPSLSSANPPSL